MIKSTLILTTVCLIAAALLGAAYQLTEEKIIEQSNLALTQALKEVLPNVDSFEKTGSYYTGKKDGLVAGFASLTEVPGYGGTIRILVGIDTSKKITGVRIMEHEETPGLGANAAKKEFYSQFETLTFDKLALKSQGGKIDAITGATISSAAVTYGVKKAYAEIEGIVLADGITGATISSKGYESDEDEKEDEYEDDEYEDSEEDD